ncbi:MAG: LysM peptidoglycan-binding domain-containing protein [Micromonosporaceae bacterium]
MTATGAAVPTLRLTRRGRVVLVTLLVFASGLIGLAAAHGAAATGTGVSSKLFEKNLSQVVVRPGDSLWSIASRAEPLSDPRRVIEQIADINALQGVQLTPGQHLWVPKD